MNKLIFGIILLAFGVFIAVFSTYFVKNIANTNEKVSLKVGEKNYILDVAKTSEEQEKGLAKFESIEDNQGMLFMFDNPGRWSFWMKDMKFNIDIIFLDENKKVVSLFKNVKSETHANVFDYRKYIPDYDSKYVIELKEGEVEKNKVKLGDIINF